MLSTGVVLLVLFLVLMIHIYVATRPKPMDERAVAMARIDIHQDITPADADKIGAWLYQQKGVDHVLCNPKTAIVVFTFHPVKVSANQIVTDFKASLNYPMATRFLPNAGDLKGGCPVASNSFSYKAYKFIKNIL